MKERKNPEVNPFANSLRKFLKTSLDRYCCFVEYDEAENAETVTLDTSTLKTQTVRFTSITEVSCKNKLRKNYFIRETTEAGTKWVFVEEDSVKIAFGEIGPFSEVEDLSQEGNKLVFSPLVIESAAMEMDSQEFKDLKTNIENGFPILPFTIIDQKSDLNTTIGKAYSQFIKDKEVSDFHDDDEKLLVTALGLFELHGKYVEQKGKVKVLRLDQWIDGEYPIILNMEGNDVNTLTINFPHLYRGLMRYSYKDGKCFLTFGQYYGSQPFAEMVNKGVFDILPEDYQLHEQNRTYESQELLYGTVEGSIKDLLKSIPYKLGSKKTDQVYKRHIQINFPDSKI